MSCGCGCNDCGGLGAPTVPDYVVAGSVIAWGGYVRDAAGTSRWSDVVEGKVKTALWNSGGFSWVDAGQISGFLNQYVSIKVTTKVDFAHFRDVLSVIEGAIYQAGMRPETQSFWIESIPASAANRTDIATPGTGGSTNPGATTTTPINADGTPKTSSGFDPCKYLNVPYLCYSPEPGAPGDSSFLDDLAGWLNIKPTEAAIIGAVGVVVAIVVVKKLL